MSSIEKLLVRGIRAFDPHSHCTVEFEPPLTVIVGHNGSGKTTLIECLKYASTGDMPPNSKQGAFVHDPKMIGECEVKAQVKLQFTSVHGKKMVVTRSLQLTQKAKQVQLKTLEVLLQETDSVTGEKLSISSRCADIDSQLPIYLGVSRAILDNVIFVHQEESNWPLAEPSVLKKKFDDIFASSRYTKALEHLRGLKKEMEAELKVEAVWLKQKEERRNRYEFLQSQKTSISGRIHVISEKSKQLAVTISEISDKIGGLIQHVASGENLQKQLDNASTQKQSILSYIEDIRQNVGDLRPNESESQLTASIEQAKTKISQQNESRVRWNREKAELQSVLEQSKATFQQKLTQKGSLTTQLRNIDRISAEIVSLYNQIHSSFDLSQDTQESVTVLLGDVVKNFENLRAQSANECDALNKNYQAAQVEIATAEANHSNILILLDQNKQKLHTLTRRLADFGTSSNVSLVEQQSRLEIAKNNLQEFLKRNEEKQLLSKVEKEEARIKELMSAISKASEAADIAARLEFLKQVLQSKEIELNTLKHDARELERLSKISHNGTPRVELLSRSEYLIKEIHTHETMDFILKQLADHSISEYLCALCLREFADDGELKCFLDSTQGMTQNIPKEVEILKTELESVHLRLSSTESVQEANMRVEILLERLFGAQRPDLFLSCVHDRVVALESEVKCLESEIEICEAASSSQPIVSSLREELDYLTNLRETMRKDVSLLSTRQHDLQRQVNVAQEEYGRLQENALRMQHSQSERESIKKTVEDMKSGNDGLEASSLSLASKIVDLKTNLSYLESKFIRVKNEWEVKMLRAEKDTERLKCFSTKLSSLTADLTRFELQRPKNASEALEIELRSIQTKISSLEDNIRSTESKIEQSNNADVHLAAAERTVRDILSYRRKMAEISLIDSEIKTLMEGIKRHQNHSYTTQLNKLKQEQDNTVYQNATIQGEKSQLEVQLGGITKEICDYAKAHDEYKEQLIKVKTHELASKDLEKNAKALDIAIMEYHTSKMDEINKLIRELWVNTYKGNDIDAVEIRADKESARGVRQYSYRVVMIKNTIDLEMRGRCSAGQKVLASIVIRLALAETFCINCGLLTLDEPTTNLDIDNIQSLADSLCHIIETRRSQSNFQLVLITHDEDFLEKLSTSGFLNHYWRVFKNEQEFSKVKKYSVTEFADEMY